MKETEQSIWQRLTSADALVRAEKILKRIEEGSLNSQIYDPIVDRLIAFSDNTRSHQESPELTNNPPTSQPLPNRISHQQVLGQLSPQERRAYERRSQTSRSIYEGNKDGRPKTKNPRKKY